MKGWLGLLAAGFLGVVLVALPDVQHGRLPGDLGDSRFNSYILEHGYLWLTGRTASFWDAPFFYPFPLATAFSDNHLGTAFVYWILRSLGCRWDDAYRGWYILGFVANFLAAAYALRRFGHSWPAVALGAYLFAFGLPVTAQDMHTQLDYRFGIPLAVLALVRFERSPRLGSLAALGFWSVWQFYCTIYLGYFLCLLLGAFAVALAVRRQGKAALSHWPALVVAAWRGGSNGARIAFVLVGIGLTVLLTGLLRPYVEVSRLYRFQRGWDEIASMLPRFASYLLADNSRLWRASWSGFDALPMRHEHQMFIGAAPLLAIAFAIWLRWRGRTTLAPLFAGAALSMGLVVLLTLSVDGHSLYRVMAGMPGVSSIRAVSRIALVLLFPAAMLFAGSVDAVISARIARPTGVAWLLLIAGLLVLECTDIDHYASRDSEWQERLTATAAELPEVLPESPILLLAPRPGEPAALRELDGMVLAQQRGWPTLNGYSGNVPAGHVVSGDCRDAPADLSRALDLLGQAGTEAFEALARRVVLVGYKDCDPSWVERRLPASTFGGALPAGIMAAARVVIEEVRLSDNSPVATLSIVNRSDLAIPAVSTTGTPVRISARYVASAGLTPEILRSPEWEFRQDLTGDVPPGGSLRVTVPLPLPPLGGPYVLAVTLVQDGVAWFHNKGMPVAVADQTILRDDSLHLAGGRPGG